MDDSPKTLEEASREAFASPKRQEPKTARRPPATNGHNATENEIKADESNNIQRPAWVVPTAIPNWKSLIIHSNKGKPLALESNGMTALRGHPDMVGLFGLDEFHQRACVMRKPPWAREDATYPRAISDADLSDLLAWFQYQGIHLRGKAPVKLVLASVVRDVRFHPVRYYLELLQWDKKRRLDNWLTNYLGVFPIDNYTGPIGVMWMISAVARIFRPGCIAKYVLIVEGQQDLGKSSALRILGGEWFTDDISTLGSKDSQMQVGNAWIIELAELASARLADISAIKAFVSRPVDQFRPPYGEHVIRQERQSVLAATVNPAGTYLHDETGAVRFWPVTATVIDLDGLTRDRDQLWAEAVARYRENEQWWPNGEFEAQEQQEARSETSASDPWFQPVDIWLREQEPENTFTAYDVLDTALKLANDRMDKRAERRVGAILRHLGYMPVTIRIDHKKTARRWRRADL